MGRTLAGVALLLGSLGAMVVAVTSRPARPHMAVVSAVIPPRQHVAGRRSAPPPCPAGFEQRVGGDRLAYAAYVHTSATAFRRPGRAPFATFGKVNVNGYPTVLGVLGAVAANGCKAAWYRVELPVRPNGTIGYVRARDVGVELVTTRLEIDLSARRLTLYRAGRRAFHAAVAVGKPATPTPIGRYYVNQKLRPSNAWGPYGPAALGVSAFSNVLTGWTQGGPIGIHGTNEPWLIGQRVSNGCIRMTNAVISRLFAEVAAGSPVIIHP